METNHAFHHSNGSFFVTRDWEFLLRIECEQTLLYREVRRVSQRKKMMLGPQNSALRADIIDFYFDKCDGLRQKAGNVRKKLEKIDARASEFQAERWHRWFVFDQRDEIRKSEGTARNLCYVGFVVILNTFFLDS